MMRRGTSWILMGALICGLAITGCDDDDDDSNPTPAGPDLNRVYVQIERLGNPLVSEVIFAKRDHGFHNSTGPNTDVTNFADDIQAFTTNVAGRAPVVGTTLSSVLLPDMLVVDTAKPGGSAGWLSWALSAGYGGRKLTDDVVDAGLMAIFGPLLDPNNVTPGLTTDNVGSNDVAFGSMFPYLGN